MLDIWTICYYIRPTPFGMAAFSLLTLTLMRKFLVHRLLCLRLCLSMPFELS